MRRVLRYIRRTLTVLALIVALCVLAVLIFTRTTTFNRILRDKAVNYLAATYRGTITVARVEGSIWGSLLLDQVAISYDGRPVAEIPRVSVSYSLASLIWGALHLEINADAPRINLVRDSDGHWNLMDALTERVRKPSKPLPFAIDLDTVGVHGGSVRIAPSSTSGPAYELAGVQLDSSIDVLRSGIKADVRRFETTVMARGMPPLYTRASLTWQNINQPATANISGIQLSTRKSALSVTGQVRQAQTISVDTTVAIENLAAADIAHIYPASPLIADLNGTIRLKGPENALHGELALNAAGAKLNGVIDADVTRKAPRYSGKLTLANAAISKIIRADGAAGVIDATLTAQGAGSDLATTTAQLTLHGRKMVADPYELGSLDLVADVDHENLRTSAILAAPAGNLKINGAAALTSNPRYHFTIVARRLNIGRAGIAATTPTDINFDASVDGHGIKPASMDTRIVGAAMASHIGPLMLDRGAVDIRIANNRANLVRMNFNAENSTLAVTGYAALAKGARSQLAYQLRSQDIGPVLKLVGQSGGGRLDVKGAISGPTDALKTRGAAVLDAIQVKSYSIQHGEIRYDLAATGPGAPYGETVANLRGIDAGVALRTLSANIRAARGTSRPIDLQLSAVDNAGRRDSVAAGFTYQPNLIAGRITELALQVPTGNWRLTAPSEFREDPRGISIHRLELKSGPRELLIDGTLARKGEQNFQVIMSQFDFAALQPMTQTYRGLGGLLSARVSITGTAAAPNLYVEINARGLRMESQHIGDLSAVVKYQPERTAIDAVLRQNATDRLTVSGTVPMALEWANGFKTRIDDGIDLRINSARLDLAQLGAFVAGKVRDFQGVASIDLALRGSISRPAPSGTIRIAGVKGEIVPLGVKISKMHAGIDVNPQAVRIITLEARAGDGTLNGAGAIGLNDYTPGSVALNVKFNQWPAIHTQEYQATLGGDIAADGTVTKPNLHGTLEVLNGTIHPDLSFLTASSTLAPDETITVIQPGENVPLPSSQALPGVIPPPPPPPPPPSQQAITYNNLALNVEVVIHRNTWIRDQYAVAELEGRLRITKLPSGPARVSGMIQTVRGWLEYQNRRFNLQTGQIEFTGGSKIDPSLNIDAQYVITNYTIDVLVGGTASKPTLQFKSQPELSQSDILSLILFGKTTSALGQNQQANLQQKAAQMAAGFAVQQVGQAVASSMGLQDLGFELSDVSTAGGSLGIGHYIGENTYVSASQTLGGAGGSKISVQYFITHWLSITTSSNTDGSREIDLNVTKQY